MAATPLGCTKATPRSIPNHGTNACNGSHTDLDSEERWEQQQRRRSARPQVEHEASKDSTTHLYLDEQVSPKSRMGP